MGMTLKEKRLWLARDNTKWPEVLTDIPREKWPKKLPGETGERTRVLRSRYFLVQVFREQTHEHFGDVARMSVNRTALDRNGGWVDGITWDELQRLKAEAGYGSYWALEFFPPSGNVVNVANLRHLWVVERVKGIGW